MYYIFKSEKNVLNMFNSDLYYRSTLKSYIYAIQVFQKSYLYYTSIQIIYIYTFYPLKLSRLVFKSGPPVKSWIQHCINKQE